MILRNTFATFAAIALLGAPAVAQDALPDTSAERPPAGVTERVVTLGSGEWAVTGIITLPAGEGPFPGAVLMHGSGPGTRDLDVGPNKVFREVAWGLAARGVAVLRYDKRATAHRDRYRALGREATMDEEFTDDGIAAVRQMQATSGVDPRRVYVIGHSQSTAVAPHIARQTRAAGVVLLAAGSRTAAQMIREQVQYAASLTARDTAEQRRTREMLAHVARMEDAATPDTAVIMGRPMSYWRAMPPGKAMDDAQALLDAGRRVMVVHGGRDYLVTDVDFEVWRQRFESRAGTLLRRYPDLNHMMQLGEGRMTPAEYNQRRQLSRQLLQDVAEWIRAR
jgi:dienelactone hydrolase